MNIVKFILPLLPCFILLGCNYESGDSPVEPASKFIEDCIVKDEWLNQDYDHEIDYENPNVTTDFFLLVYSNSPNFCDYMERKNRIDDVPFQCQSPNEFGWVVHGLWSESEAAYLSGQNDGHPRFCKGNLDPLDLETIKPYLCMSPGTGLLQGEWEKHGACDFESATKYFSKTQELYEQFLLPPPELKVRTAVEWMKENNFELEGKRLHQSKHEFGVCLSTSFEVISCPRN